MKETSAEKLLLAVKALRHPDGIIRGPLQDGPELDTLNQALQELGTGEDDIEQARRQVGGKG